MYIWINKKCFIREIEGKEDGHIERNEWLNDYNTINTVIWVPLGPPIWTFFIFLNIFETAYSCILSPFIFVSLTPPIEVRRWHWVPWHRSDWCLWVTKCGCWEVNSISITRGVNAFNSEPDLQPQIIFLIK